MPVDVRFDQKKHKQIWISQPLDIFWKIKVWFVRFGISLLEVTMSIVFHIGYKMQVKLFCEDNI